jgi:hypothetical protein
MSQWAIIDLQRKYFFYSNEQEDYPDEIDLVFVYDGN